MVFFVPSDVELRAVEFPEFDLKFSGKGHKIGVGAESAHQEEAMGAAAAIYSDSELSNALVYGKEGESYQIENGLTVRQGEYGTVGGGSSKDLESELKALSEEADALGLETVLEKLDQQLGGVWPTWPLFSI